MNPGQISHLASKGAALRGQIYGVPVRFRGAVLTAVFVSSAQQLEILTGPARLNGDYTFRIPSTVQPPPAAREEFWVIHNNRKLVVVGCDDAPPGSLIRKEHTVDVRLA